MYYASIALHDKNAREVKLLVMLEGLTRKFVWEKRKALERR